MRLGCHWNVSIFRNHQPATNEEDTADNMTTINRNISYQSVTVSKIRAKIKLQLLYNLKSCALSIHKKLKTQASSMISCTS